MKARDDVVIRKTANGWMVTSHQPRGYEEQRHATFVFQRWHDVVNWLSTHYLYRAIGAVYKNSEGVPKP